jgi:signal transduction histidine kinase
MKLTSTTAAAPVTRIERVLGVGRAFLTVSALGAIYLDPTQPARLAGVTYTVLAAYAIYSVAVLVAVQRARRVSAMHGILLHGLDILWTAGLTFVSEGPVSPFFLFFLFVVLAAAHRWGFAGTIATAGVTVAVFLIQTAIAATGPWSQTWFASIGFELNFTILRVAYLLLTGFLLGYLAEQEKRSRAELAAIAEVTRQPRVHLGLGGSIAAIARGLLRTFDGDSIYVVLQDYDTKETNLWQFDHMATEGLADPPRRSLTPEQQKTWMFPDVGRVWEGTWAKGDDTVATRAIEHGAWSLRRDRVAIPPEIAAPGSYRRVVVANLGLADEWRGRVYVFNPALGLNPVLGSSIEEALHFVDALFEHATPALTNVFLLGRLRDRATAAERARVARELHDGAIQTLFGVEMKVEALRRGAGAVTEHVATELESIQDLLRREVLALRELMQALRPIGLDASDQLPDVLANMVERFRRDTGVSARFVFSGRPVNVPPTTAMEIVRIVQEALVNVRKHSRARNVLVRLAGSAHGCTLNVEDDGVGLEFEGTLCAEELEQRRLGPAIIKERARIAGGRLSIDSTPGSGTRINLTIEAAV